VADVPDGGADLVFVCTPVETNVEVLRECAAKGVRAAFVMTAGYGEIGDAGRRAEAELVAVAAELDLLLAGPNGQGVVSTPSALCAQMVAPYPPPGRIAVASQSGNIVSSIENLARHSGVGVSRAVSAGNAAAVGVVDYVEYFADDDATAVALAYLEGVDDGRALFERLRAATAAKPVVLVKGGATGAGRQAAASHTGALATDDRVFTGACRQAGVTLAATVEEAYDAAATFATQPLPPGPNTLVLTTAGGWGVLAADAISRSRLHLVELPPDLRAAIDEKLPPRWSRANPVDLAASETRDTIPEVLELAAAHPDVHAIVFLGLGVQSNQSRLLRTGPFAADEAVGRIASFHERQDERYARAAAEASEATGKPILCATELAVSDPDNPGPRAVRATGRYCAPSAHRAVRALEHLWTHARHGARRAA
jgi:acetyltransferase